MKFPLLLSTNISEGDNERVGFYAVFKPDNEFIGDNESCYRAIFGPSGYIRHKSEKGYTIEGRRLLVAVRTKYKIKFYLDISAWIMVGYAMVASLPAFALAKAFYKGLGYFGVVTSPGFIIFVVLFIIAHIVGLVAFLRLRSMVKDKVNARHDHDGR